MRLVTVIEVTASDSLSDLPADNHLTKLIVAAEHLRLHHAGPQLLIASLRERYWVPRIRNLVKSIIYQCLICYRLKVQTSP
jgi:hypothetical protein